MSSIASPVREGGRAGNGQGAVRASSTPGSVARLLDVLGACACAAGLVWFVRVGIVHQAISYDEGILLTTADALRHGRVLYREAYVSYPPGIFLLVSACMSVFGASYTVLRVLGTIVRLWLALITGRLAGRVAGRPFSWFAAGWSLLWLTSTLAAPFAWSTALATLLTAVEMACLCREHCTRRRLVLLGVLLGAVGSLRHDLFGFTAAVLGCVALVLLVLRRVRLGALLRSGVWALVPMTALIAGVWGPTLVAAGPATVWRDVVTVQASYVRSARVLPVLDPFQVVHSPIHGFTAPAFVVSTYGASVLLVCTVPLVAALVAMRRARRGSGSWWVTALLVGAAAVSLPQYLQRGDATHALFAVSPALALVAGALERMVAPDDAGAPARVRRPLRVALAGPALALAVLPIVPEMKSVVHPRHRSAVVLGGRFGRTKEVSDERADARRAAVAFLAEHSTPAQTVYAGCRSHRRMLANELDLYFLADRRSVTRWAQFDPGLQTTEWVQREIISALTSSPVPAMVLADCEWEPEPNTSRLLGSPLLDTWIRAHYRVVGRVPGYDFLVPR